MLYGFLLVALMVALWLTEGGSHRWARWSLAVIGVLFLLPHAAPNTSSTIWSTKADTPAFFADGEFRAYLSSGDTVLVIPFGDRGNSMLWQVEAGFSFRMVEGYVNVVPPKAFSEWPILRTFYTGEPVDRYAQQLPAFLGAHAVRAVIVADGAPGDWPELFSSLGHPEHVGGVSLYRVPESILRSYRGASPPD